jgi:hypothetical protein
MTIVFRFAVACLVLGLAGPATAAADPHTPTWAPRTAAPGTAITIAGTPLIAVRIPVEDLGPAAGRYAVSFLAPNAGGTVRALVATVHSNEPLVDPIQIDGFDAILGLSDARSYGLVGPPGNRAFSVLAQVTCGVHIKLGATLVSVAVGLHVEQQSSVHDTLNLVPHAEWADWVHPTAQVNGCDRWLDYVRVIKLGGGS